MIPDEDKCLLQHCLPQVHMDVPYFLANRIDNGSSFLICMSQCTLQIHPRKAAFSVRFALIAIKDYADV